MFSPHGRTHEPKPTHKAIKTFHTALGAYNAQDITHELAVKTAFQTLLADTARARKWLLVPELTMRHRGRHIRPDGVLRDEFAIPRGYWETKDTHDDLDREIQNKIANGYPTTNIIFDDTQHAVLYQDGQEVLRVDLRSSAEIAELLNAFYTHTEPDIEEFERAVDRIFSRRLI